MSTLLDLHLAAFPGDEIQTSDGTPHVSASQLKMFARCPEQYRQRYVLGRKERPAGALVWGGADHEAHEINFRQKTVSHVDMPEADLKEAFAVALDTRIEKDGGPGEVEWERGVVHTGDDARKQAAIVKDNGVNLAALYHREVSPRLQPLGVEEWFELPASTLGSNIKLVGRLDLRATVTDVAQGFRPGAPGPATTELVIERKTTGAKKKAIDNPEYVTQARIEQLGGALLHGRTLDVDFHLSLKQGSRRKNPGVVHGDPDYTLVPAIGEFVVLAQIRRLIAGISSSYAMYGPDEPWPGSWAGFASPCGYCGFAPDCPWWHEESWT